MLTVHIISDSIGNTAKDVVKAALVQFSYSDARYKVLKNSLLKVFYFHFISHKAF